MTSETEIINILDAESERPRETYKKFEDLSAWSQNQSFEKEKPKKIIKVLRSRYPKLETAYNRYHYEEKKLSDTSIVKENQRISEQEGKVTTSFTAYINSIFDKNSLLNKRYPKFNREKRLEIMSVKIGSSQNPNRTKTISPEKFHRPTKKLLENSFLVKNKVPPSVAGYPMTFYHKFRKNNLNLIENC
jgi:hypothetical protein